MTLKIVHVITSLGAGGAEQALFNLLAHIPSAAASSQVICLTAGGVNAERINALGVPVHLLEMKPGSFSLSAFIKLQRLIRAFHPDIVQTWMYHADLLGGLAARLAGVRNIIWGIHHADLSPQWNKPGTINIARLCGRLSGWMPKRIVLVAESARPVHVALGYDQRKMIVIPNGVDTARFRPNPQTRNEVRAELGIPADAPLVILPARFHPIKDQRTFLQAAGTTAGRVPDAQFILCGSDINADNEEIVNWISNLGLGLYTHLLGQVEDMPRLLAACDIGCLSSISEAFPLSLVEMMACGLPCAVTAAGDCPPIVGDTGRVVPVSDAPALANALSALLALTSTDRQELGIRARQRVEQNYSIERMVQRYATLWSQVVNEGQK